MFCPHHTHPCVLYYPERQFPYWWRSVFFTFFVGSGHIVAVRGQLPGVYFFPTMWVLELKLGSAGLVESAIIHWAISQTQNTSLHLKVWKSWDENEMYTKTFKFALRVLRIRWENGLEIFGKPWHTLSLGRSCCCAYVLLPACSSIHTRIQIFPVQLMSCPHALFALWTRWPSASAISVTESQDPFSFPRSKFCYVFMYRKDFLFHL